jgi:hypothetical protein
LARRLAERTLQADPSLTKSSYAALNKLLGDDDSEASALQ